MAAYNGLYRARATKLQGTTLTAYIPQVFGNTPILINDFVGDPPVPPTMGWVSFHGGNAEIPVWFGAITQEMLAQAVADAPYVHTAGDMMTGILRSNRTGAANVDGAIHIEILSNGTQIGRITRATSATAGFLTSSDADLKENFAPIDDSLAMQWMTTITPYFFNYKDKPDVRHVGYNAQEVAAQWPNGVSNGIILPGHGNIEDRTWDADGQETTPKEVWESWMMDHSKITPILHACLLTMDRKVNSRFATNTVRIEVLEQVVATQATQIEALQTLVATQGGQITALQQSQATQDSQIATNKKDIADNAAAATANTGLVSQLRSDVYNTRRVMCYWQYSNTATGPPGSGQMRTSAPTLNTLWLHRIDTDGFDRDNYLRTIVDRTALDATSVRFRISGATGSMFEIRTTAVATYDGTSATIPVQVITGTSGAKGFRAEVTILTQIWAATTPPTGPTFHDPEGPL